MNDIALCLFYDSVIKFQVYYVFKAILMVERDDTLTASCAGNKFRGEDSEFLTYKCTDSHEVEPHTEGVPKWACFNLIHIFLQSLKGMVKVSRHYQSCPAQSQSKRLFLSSLIRPVALMEKEEK